MQQDPSPALFPSMCSIAFQSKDKWAAHPLIEESICDLIPCVAEAGFAGIEIWHPHWDCLHAGERLRALVALQRYKLQVPMLSAYYNFTRSLSNAQESLVKGHRVLEQARELGAQAIRIFTGNHRSADATAEQWHRTVSCLRELCAHGRDCGVRLCLETHDWNLMDTVPGCLQLLERVNAENLGLIFQASTFGPHRWRWALKHLAPWIWHVHAPPSKCPLSADVYDYRGQLSALLGYGMRGFVSLEYMGPQARRRMASDGRWLIGLCAQLTRQYAQQ